MSHLIKTPAQIEAIRRAGQIVGSVLYDLRSRLAVGITPRALDTLARQLIQERHGRPAFLGYHGYPNTLCISVNDVVVHGIPSEVPFAPGDIVGIDAGAISDGWYADAAITVGIGKISPGASQLLAVTERALAAGIARAVPGQYLGDIQAAIQRVIEEEKLGIVRHLTGHGIGRTLHEAPEIPNYGRPGTGLVLQPGMVLCLEPMVTIGDPRVTIDKDGWTIRTADHSLGAQFEHTLAITETGPEILTTLRPWPRV